MEKLDLTAGNLRKFGLTIGAVLFLINFFLLLRHKHGSYAIVLVSALFLLSSLIRPATLKLVYISWMRTAFLLSWINTRLVLIIIFYFVFSPLGFIIKLCGKDLLERKIEANKSSYWKQKERLIFDKSNYERQF